MTLRRDFFTQLRANQGTYRPRDEIAQQLRDKSLLMLVGPTCIGKSTVMNVAVKSDQRLGRVSGFTTRAKRANDEPGVYRYIETDEDYEKLEHDIQNGELIQYAVSPTQDVTYGTALNDYLAEFNLKDTFYSAVADDQKLPFKQQIAVGVVAEPTNWMTWFAQRFQPGDPEVPRRLEEARQCLTWLLEHKDEVKWLQNDELDIAAQRLSAVCSDTDEPWDGSSLAQAMLDSIPELEKRFA